MQRRRRSLTCLYPKTGVDGGMFRVAHVVTFKYSKNLKNKFTAFPQLHFAIISRVQHSRLCSFGSIQNVTKLINYVNKC